MRYHGLATVGPCREVERRAGAEQDLSDCVEIRKARLKCGACSKHGRTWGFDARYIIWT